MKSIIQSLLVAIACLGLAFSACGKAPSKNAIEKRVQQLMAYNAYVQPEMLFTESMAQLNHDAMTTPDFATGYQGFDWQGKVFDVCSEQGGKVSIESIYVADDTNARAIMRYVDSGCYDFNYTVLLKWERDNWYIDNVLWTDRGDDMPASERDEAFDYLEQARIYLVDPANAADIVEQIRNEAQAIDSIDDPDVIYHNNPQAVRDLITTLETAHEIFKDNPGYTPAMGKTIDKSVAHVRQRAIQAGLKL